MNSRLLLQSLKVKDLKTLEKEWHEYVKLLKPASARGYVEAGQQAMRWSRPILAQRLFRTAIEKGSKSSMAYHGLASALMQKDKHVEAMQNLEKAIEIDPLNGLFYADLARCRARESKNEKDDEVKRLRRLALEVDPDNDSLIYTMGMEEYFEEQIGKTGQ